MSKIIFFSFLSLFFCKFVVGQSNINLKLITLSVYPVESENVALFKYGIDKKGLYAFEPGIILSYEYFGGDQRTSFELSQAVFIDRAAQLAGFTHIGIRRVVFTHYRHSLCLGIGPAFYYRNNWSDLSGYVEDEGYSTEGEYQYKLVWLSGEIEYGCYISKKVDIMASLNMTHPKAFSLAVGLRYWISKKKRKACDCPSF